MLLFHLLSHFFYYLVGWYNYDQVIRGTIDTLIKHNIIFIKVFQALSSNEFFEKKFNNHLKQCTNHANFYQEDQDEALLATILQTYDIELYQNKPINSGMIALAYKGKINKTNTDVIIKMKRKNIKKRLVSGYAEFRFWYKIIRWISFNSDMMNSISSFIDTEEYIVSQCDFEQEIVAMKRTKREISETVEKLKIKGLEKIVIPSVYNHDDESRFIVIEFLAGVSCFEAENKYDTLYTLSSFGLTSIFVNSHFHTDLHPGNLICMDNGQLGIIDFGMTVEVSSKLNSGFMGVIQILMGNINSNDKSADYLSCFTQMVEPPLDLSLFTTEERDTANVILTDLFTSLFCGKLTEYEIRIYLKKIFGVSKKSKNYRISLPCFKLLLGFTMFNASVFSLTNDTKVINDIQMEIFVDVFM